MPNSRQIENMRRSLRWRVRLRMRSESAAIRASSSASSSRRGRCRRGCGRRLCRGCRDAGAVAGEEGDSVGADVVELAAPLALEGDVDWEGWVVLNEGERGCRVEVANR
jgi:hypothetical protein